MADKKKSGDAKAERIAPSNAKVEDIQTAAKSTMDDANYEHGYPANEGELLNRNFSSRGKG